MSRRRRARAQDETPGVPLRVAILGRPNVGKSTLFNRLVGRRAAIVHDRPGVTRDRRIEPGSLAGMLLEVIDTAGLEEAPPDSLEGRMRRQTERALAGADVVLLLIDARAGSTPLDRRFADWLRSRALPVVLVANKCEGEAARAAAYDAYALGLGDPVPLSAEHGEGLADLYDALAPFQERKQALAGGAVMPAHPKADAAAGDDPGAATGGDTHGAEPEAVIRPAGPLQLAIVGRPNVGKSTLLNRLLGEERALTGPEAGITRDAIAANWRYGGRDIRLVDTAGMRRQAKRDGRIEGMSVSDALRAIRFSQVVVLVLDATEPPTKQDLAIAGLVEGEGRALTVALNKWDVVADRWGMRAEVARRLEESLAQLKGVPTIALSARTGTGIARLMEAVFQVHEIWNRRIPTTALNRWLSAVEARHPPPAVSGRRIRLRYITQPGTRPPTFALWASRAEHLPESYQRYLVNSLREAFNLPAVPLRLTIRKGKNPFAPS